mgnify:CR=1 FL=1
MEGVLERGVLALEILNGLGSASRRLPLELEHLQVEGPLASARVNYGTRLWRAARVVPTGSVGRPGRVLEHTQGTGRAPSGRLPVRRAAARAQPPPRRRSRPAAPGLARGGSLARPLMTRFLPRSAARCRAPPRAARPSTRSSRARGRSACTGARAWRCARAGSLTAAVMSHPLRSAASYWWTRQQASRGHPEASLAAAAGVVVTGARGHPEAWKAAVAAVAAAACRPLCG